MKKEFSTHWNASSQPRKQRKYLAKAPLHLRKKFVSVNLSKDLRKEHGKRNIPVRKDDVVKILRGKFKGKSGKITDVYLKISKVLIDGIQTKKQDGSKIGVKMRPSNLQITELNLDDRKRKINQKEIKKEKKEDAPKKTKSS